MIYVRNSCFNWDAALVENDFKGDVEKYGKRHSPRAALSLLFFTFRSVGGERRQKTGC